MKCMTVILCRILLNNSAWAGGVYCHLWLFLSLFKKWKSDREDLWIFCTNILICNTICRLFLSTIDIFFIRTYFEYFTCVNDMHIDMLGVAGAGVTLVLATVLLNTISSVISSPRLLTLVKFINRCLQKKYRSLLLFSRPIHYRTNYRYLWSSNS